MSPPDDFFEWLARSSIEVRERLKADSRLGPYIDDTLPIPQPYGGRGPGRIKLVIIGQDPTVGSRRIRQRIQQALMLDEEQARLTVFLSEVCAALGISLKDEVYATNLCKCFFTEPPRAVKSPRLIAEAGPAWLDLLRRELDRFPHAAVISLGEPILDVLLLPTEKRRMKWYWAHDHQDDGADIPFRLVHPGESAIGRRLFPFIHLNSDNRFYGSRRAAYQEFILQDIRGADTVTAP